MHGGWNSRVRLQNPRRETGHLASRHTVWFRRSLRSCERSLENAQRVAPRARLALVSLTESKLSRAARSSPAPPAAPRRSGAAHRSPRTPIRTTRIGRFVQPRAPPVKTLKPRLELCLGPPIRLGRGQPTRCRRRKTDPGLLEAEKAVLLKSRTIDV